MFGSGRVGIKGESEYIGFGFTNPVGPGEVWDVCLCLGCCGMDDVGGVGGGLGQGMEGWRRLCVCVL